MCAAVEYCHCVCAPVTKKPGLYAIQVIGSAPTERDRDEDDEDEAVEDD